MRDPKRIRPLCERLTAAWSTIPDLRLGQLIVNAVYTADSNLDPFYIEDERLIREIESFVYRATSGGADR